MSVAARLKPAAGFIILGLLLYLVFVVATIPAALIADVTEKYSDGVHLLNARGTVWRGSAQLSAGTSATGIRDLGRIHWNINPWWLFVGRAQVGVQLDGQNVRGRTNVGISRHRIALEDLDASLPAGLASLVYAPAAFFEPSGTIDVRTSTAELTATGLEGKIEAQWRGAGGRFTGPSSLGDYGIDIEGKGPNATIQLRTLRGDLNLSGQGTWNVAGDGAIRFTGRAQPRGNAAQFEPLLRTLGRDLGNGQRQIRFNARIPLVQQLDL